MRDLHDFLGLRIITYYPDEVDEVALIVRNEFDIVPSLTRDHRHLMDPTRFGYASLHYVAQLSAERADLAEYRRYAEYRFELQIRSILQHAWAEIEHDLGYKTAEAIPRDFRRRFSSLASHLESADTEFVRIREELAAYNSQLVLNVLAGGTGIEIDQDSLLVFIRHSALVANLDQYIANALGGPLNRIDQRTTGLYVRELGAVGLRVIADLDSELQRREHELRAFTLTWLDGRINKSGPGEGVSLFYLFYLRVSDLDDPRKIKELLRSLYIGSEEDCEKQAHRLIALKGGGAT
jgi:hypothetical protein